MPDETLNSPSETNGAPNGAANGAHAVHATSNEPTTADAATPPKEDHRSARQKTRDRRREQAATPVIAATTEPVALAVPEAPVDEPAEAPAMAEGAVAASEDPVVMAPSLPEEPALATASSEVPAAEAPGETAPLEESAVPQEAITDALRLRSKVWTDRLTGRRYLMPTAFMRDVVKGQPVSDVMYAYAMRDDDTKLVTLTAREWNSLPFYYFHEDGPAPRATARPVDVIR